MTPEGAEQLTPDEAAARLCVSCGLCCGSPYFGYVELQPGDDAAMLATLLPLERKGDKTIFRLPCPALKGACCQIYAQRPQVCRGYRCRVLKEVLTTPAKLPEALERVKVMVAAFKTLKERLREAGFLTDDANSPAAYKAFRMAYVAALEANDAAFFAQHRELILRWKKTVWLLQVFDEKVAGRLALSAQAASALGKQP